MNEKEDEIFFDKLEKYPRLKKRFDEILNIAENSSGELVTADEAEAKAIEEVRKLGQELLKEWAVTQHEKAIQNAKKEHPKVRKHLKKNSIGNQRMDE